MRKFLLVIAVFCFFFETSALADNEKAQKYLREAEYYVKKAERRQFGIRKLHKKLVI